VLVAAPREQHTGAGRSMPTASAGNLRRASIELAGRAWNGYAVEGSPAQAVQHALLEPPAPAGAAHRRDQLRRERRHGVTIPARSGRARGRDLRRARAGDPLEIEKHITSAIRTRSTSASRRTSRACSRACSTCRRNRTTLKVEVPATACARSWRVTRLSRQRYYHPVRPTRDDCETEGRIDYYVTVDEHVELDSDVYALMRDRVVSVTPISLDVTSRVSLGELEQLLLTTEAQRR
jgi:5'-nucleotidase